jgi:hypothetical protein
MLKEDINVDKKNEIIKTFVISNNYILLSIFGFTLLGTLFYTSEKQIQYGGGFNLLNFWFC